MHTLLQTYIQSNQNLRLANQSQTHDHSNCDSQSCSSGMISSLYNVVTSQAVSLESLSKKVEDMVEKNRELNKKIKEL